MFPLKITKLDPKATIPEMAHHGDAGMDIYSVESTILKAGDRKAIKTGIATAFPAGYVALIWDRSSMAYKHGIKTMAGVIDSGYRGEWKIVMKNLSNEDKEIKVGDKIAQAIFQKYFSPEIEEVNELPESVRGNGGFGSTGS